MNSFKHVLTISVAVMCLLLGTGTIIASDSIVQSLESRAYTQFPTDQPTRRDPDRIVTQVFAGMSERIRFAGGFLLVLGVMTVIFRTQIVEFLNNLQSADKDILQYLYGVYRATSVTERIFLFLFMLIAIILRAIYISQPMRGDESVTYNIFASRPLYIGLAYYPAPNNHLFHTLLVHFSTMFGNTPAFIRLPAFSSGVLLVPATYALGRRLFTSQVGLFASALVSVSSILIEYSTNGRGYTTQILLFLMAFISMTYLVKSRNMIVWLVFGVCCVLSYYTIPTTLYPFGVLLLWGVWATFNRSNIVQWSLFSHHIVVSSIVVTLFTILLYLPVLLVSGPNALLGNETVSPLDWNVFMENLSPLFFSTWEQWNRDIPWPIAGLLAVGVVVALVRHSSYSRFLPIVPLVTLVWCVPVVFVQRVVPFARVWLFLLPIYFIYAALGIYILCKRAKISLRLMSILFPLILGFAVINSQSVLKSPGDSLRAAEPIAVLLKQQLVEGDRVYGGGAILTYYFTLHEIPKKVIELDPNTEANRLWLIMKSADVMDTISVRSIKTRFPNYDTVELVDKWEDASLYLLTND